jgi:hypothetical protein
VHDHGYQRGLALGARDARSGRAADFRRDRDYRGGDWGCQVWFGPRGVYISAFRNGFETGYNDGYEKGLDDAATTPTGARGARPRFG